MVSIFGCNVILYFVGQILKDNGIVDITWGMIYVLSNISVIFVNRNINERTILSNVLLIVWAFRMAVNNGMRHKGEDWRYMDMRKKWMAKGKCFYYFAAYTFIYFV